MSPAVADVRTAVRRCLADLGPGDAVLVACSGGADSLALAAAAAFVGPRAGWAVGAVVVDHRWSPASGEVAAAAGEACRTLGLAPVDVVRVDASTGRGGPEAVARDARYAALEAAARRHGARAVLLGHTLDDQAETVLLGLARGSGTRSLAGMPARRGPFRRPLLDLPRTATVRACADQGLEPWHDPANTDPAYTRSRVRALMPQLEAALGPGFAAALARTAALAREDADALDAQAGALLAAASDPGVLEVGVLAAAPDAVRRRALRAAARAAGSPAGALGRRHVLALDALVTRWRGQGPVHLPGGVGARRACGRLVLVPARDRPGDEGHDDARDDAHDDAHDRE